MAGKFTPTSADALLPDPFEVPLERLDVSDSRLILENKWHGYFARLRNEDPVHFLKDSPFGPFWSVTRYEDIVFVDGHPELFSAEPYVTIGDQTEEDGMNLETFVAMDPPRHGERRSAVQPVVAPANLKQMESLIRERVAKILDSLPLNETFDWVPKVSIDITSQMLATLFDYPMEERHKLIEWTEAAVSSPATGGDMDPQERLSLLQEFAQAFAALWQQKAKDKAEGKEGGFDLINLLLAGEATRDLPQRPDEFMGTLLLLLIGGNDTTRNSITAGVMALNQFPTEYEKLKANPQLINSMVPEIIRWQTPIVHMRRTAKQDVELNGKQIKKGDKVVMWYISGNRDERAIEKPNEFIIDRANPRQHLSFGFGVHRCMGNRLAEMQVRVLWEEIMKRFDRIEVEGEPKRVHSIFQRAISSLPVKVHPKKVPA